jgi:Domain of unknown function (DUF927)
MPWPSADEPGFINMHAMGTGSDGKKFWTGTPTRDVDQFQQAVANAQTWKTPPDIYFCMSRQGMTKTSSKDDKVRAAKSQEHALALKGVWLDLDVKEKSFPTLTAAVTALEAFYTKYGLPPPTAMVMSGGGLHAHWINARCMTVAEWRPYAEGLKVAAIEFFEGHMDTGVIADCARVLRIPSTFNYKQSTPRAVKLLGMRDTDYDFTQALAMLPDLCSRAGVVLGTPFLPGKPDPRFAALPKESLSAGIGRTEFPPLDPTPLVKECGWFKEALTTGGKDFSQGLWNLTTLAATFMENGNALAHRMARGYPGYARLETEELWDRKLAERRDTGLGWPSCRAIQAEGCRHCGACVHLAGGKSPLHLARVSHATLVAAGATGGVPPPVAFSTGGTLNGATAALVPLTTSDLPDTFVMQGDVIHKVLEVKEHGEEPSTHLLPIFHSHLYKPWAQSNPDALNFITSVDLGSYRDVSLLRAKLTPMELNTALAEAGVSPRVENEKYIREFLVSWLAKLNTAAAARSNVPFGWHMNANTCEGFSYGSVLYKPDGTRGPVGRLDPNLKTMYGPEGELGPWMDCMHMITAQQRPGLEVVVAAGLGAPLMFGTGEYSVLMSVFGDSGAGKSSAARVSTAIWAKPILAKEVETATVKSVIHRLGQIRHLPYFWDEIKDDKAQAHAYDVLYVCSAGAEGSRLRSNITQNDKGSWQTICGIFSNPSFGDYVIKRNGNTTAGLMRVFEWKETKPGKKDVGQISPSEASRMLLKLDSNYGQMGKLYAAWLGANRDVAAALVKKYNDFYEAATSDPDRNTNDERFWIAFAAAVTAGAEIANTHLGTNFDLVAMIHFLLEKLKWQRSRTIEENMEGGSFDHTEMMLTNFLKANWKRTAVTETSAVRAKGRPTLINLVRAPKDGEPCQVQWVLGAGLLLFSKTEFNRWLRQPDVNGNPRSLMEGLKQFYKATTSKGTLCKGIPSIQCGQEPLVTIPVTQGGPLWRIMMNEDEPVPAAVSPPTSGGGTGPYGSTDTAGLYANADANPGAPR